MTRIAGLKWPYVAALVLAGGALVALRVFFFQPFDAPSVSMEPSVNLGDYFIVSLQAYAFHDPERGDVVAFRGRSGAYVKRVVGIPGDRVQMRRGVLFLNGKAVPRRRVEDFRDEDAMIARATQYVETLPSGRSYHTLDLTTDGPLDDSRLDVGFLARADVEGRVVVKFVDGRSRSAVWKAVD